MIKSHGFLETISFLNVCKEKFENFRPMLTVQ